MYEDLFFGKKIDAHSRTNLMALWLGMLNDKKQENMRYSERLNGHQHCIVTYASVQLAPMLKG